LIPGDKNTTQARLSAAHDRKTSGILQGKIRSLIGAIPQPKRKVGKPMEKSETCFAIKLRIALDAENWGPQILGAQFFATKELCLSENPTAHCQLLLICALIS
jgi:hypothetical protein